MHQCTILKCSHPRLHHSPSPPPPPHNLLQVLADLEAASLSSTGCPEADAVDATLSKLPAGATDPLVAWQLLKDMRPNALAHATARRAAVLRLYRIIDTSIAQHQVRGSSHTKRGTFQCSRSSP